jgi:hypothetical protein
VSLGSNCNGEKKADESLGVDGVSRYAIVFFSNQLTPKRHATNAKTVEAYQTEWKKKIGLIARAVRILPPLYHQLVS